MMKDTPQLMYCVRLAYNYLSVEFLFSTSFDGVPLLFFPKDFCVIRHTLLCLFRRRTPFPEVSPVAGLAPPPQYDTIEV